jgi:uncharacterized protein
MKSTVVNSEIGAVVILEPGDELHASVVRAAKIHGLKGAFVSAIGAVDDLELGYFRLPEKTYDRMTTRERLEVVSLTGNLALKDGEPFLHVHGVFSGPDFKTIGGHVFRAVASVTLEVMMIRASALKRVPFPEFGLTRIDPYCG